MVDATLGLGGHTEAVLTRCELARVIGIDRDPARARAGRRAAGRLRRPVHRRARGVRRAARGPRRARPRRSVDAVLFDLGVSSMQLDVRERGFAYAEDAPLDMRMDGSTGQTAADVLNTYSAKELTRVLREYGEERFASKIAAAVVRQREQSSRSRPRPASSSCCTPRSRRRRDGPAATPPSAPSRRSGWRSTTSSRSCAGPFPPRSTPSGSVAGWSSRPTTRSRTGWSSRRSPP